jgi:hypothetical protein
MTITPLVEHTVRLWMLSGSLVSQGDQHVFPQRLWFRYCTRKCRGMLEPACPRWLCCAHVLLLQKTNGIIDRLRQEGRGFLAFVFAGYPMQEERRDG